MKARYYYNPVVKKTEEVYQIELYVDVCGKGVLIKTLTDTNYNRLMKERVSVIESLYESKPRLSIFDIIGLFRRK